MFVRIFGGALLVLALFVLTVVLGPIVPALVALALLGLATILMASRAPRRPWMHSGLPVAALLILLPGYAFAASIDIGQALNGSLQEIISGIVTAVITAVVGWLAWIAKNKLHIDIEARHREALIAFLNRQASGLVAAGAVKVQGLKVEVQNQALADAANTALQAIPGVLAFFGLTPLRLQDMIVDLIPKQPAVAQAQAVALDVANPATPSKPA